ncbi:MAG: hypothetical protein P1U88_11780 [Thalassobaculaceae bacterium]|nr:hypothetical protein [Thalassobaculaceae bacterium]
MSISLILCLSTLTLLVATATIGIAIAVIERKGVVPRLAETTFMGLAGAGSIVLMASVVVLHPLTAETLIGSLHAPSVTSTAMAAEIDAAEEPACVSLADFPAYDRGQARFEGDGAKGEGGHEVSVFRSPGPR